MIERSQLLEELPDQSARGPGGLRESSLNVCFARRYQPAAQGPKLPFAQGFKGLAPLALDSLAHLLVQLLKISNELVAGLFRRLA